MFYLTFDSYIFTVFIIMVPLGYIGPACAIIAVTCVPGTFLNGLLSYFHLLTLSFTFTYEIFDCKWHEPRALIWIET
jgi:hypothetical protein